MIIQYRPILKVDTCTIKDEKNEQLPQFLQSDINQVSFCYGVNLKNIGRGEAQNGKIEEVKFNSDKISLLISKVNHFIIVGESETIMLQGQINNLNKNSEIFQIYIKYLYKDLFNNINYIYIHVTIEFKKNSKDLFEMDLDVYTSYNNLLDSFI